MKPAKTGADLSDRREAEHKMIVQDPRAAEAWGEQYDLR